MQQASNHSTNNREGEPHFIIFPKEGLFAILQPTMENLPFIVMTDHKINVVINNSSKPKKHRSKPYVFPKV